MDQTQFFPRMFKYDEWANRETLASLKSSEAAPARALKLMSHVIAAEHVWLDRLKQDKQGLAVWPELSLQECETHLDDLSRLWQEYLGGLGANDYSREVSYANSKGEVWATRIEDILTHVLMHSAQHRGQVALDLRASGQTPAYTDFIHAARQGFLE